MAEAVSSSNMAVVEMLVLKGAVWTTDVVMTYQHQQTDTDLCYQLNKAIESKNNDLVQRIIDTGIRVNDKVSNDVM